MKDKEFFMLLESYESALENGNVASLGLSQDDFLDIIDYYEDVFDGKNLTKACEIAFGQYSYSAEINERYIDALLKEGRNSWRKTPRRRPPSGSRKSKSDPSSPE